jgi:hypothetical protein
MMMIDVPDLAVKKEGPRKIGFGDKYRVTLVVW